jgi:hypothetical protein
VLPLHAVVQQGVALLRGQGGEGQVGDLLHGMAEEMGETLRGEAEGQAGSELQRLVPGIGYDGRGIPECTVYVENDAVWGHGILPFLKL